MQTLSTNVRFESVDELRQELGEAFTCDTDVVGYISPGHGLKGKKVWIEQDEDLDRMYELHKKNITLCCYEKSTDGPDNPPSKRHRSRS